MAKNSEQVDEPHSMQYPIVRERRKAMLRDQHIAPLTVYAAKLRKMKRGFVPEFDPLDGGINAQILFLFEKPGPMTDVSHGGSGFISRDNNDPTAKATFDFMHRAGIPREHTLIWNVIPWWNGERKITGAERRNGVEELKELITLLPKLKAVVMVGRQAQKAKKYFCKEPNLMLFESYHTSPLVYARYSDKWKAIPREWRKAWTWVIKNNQSSKK